MELSNDNIIIYHNDSSQAIEVYLREETLWLTQEQMAVLFGRDRSVITKHLRNIFKTGELNEESNVQKMHAPFSDKPVRFYSTDAVISVGYRVNSIRGTQFRIWATGVLKNYLIQGYAVNERRLKEQTEKLLRQFVFCRSSLAVVLYSGEKKTNRFKARWELFISHSVVRMYIPVLRKRRRICCTL